ncbi:MAG: SpoIIE family protein phosphatase [Victivallaceae bacterium]|nr:SpoIIE family protein phosphatase [Victivallaceae bacterium]
MKGRKSFGLTGYIVTTVFFFAVIVTTSWIFASRWAWKQTVSTLEWAEGNFIATLDDEIALELRFVAIALQERLGGCHPCSAQEMQQYAADYQLDEINIVDANGIVIASNLPEIIGADFHNTLHARDFLVLMEPTRTAVSHRFRISDDDQGAFHKYYGIHFPDKSGFLQLGVSYRRFTEQVHLYSEYEYKALLNGWKFENVGHYQEVEDLSDFRPGKIFERRTPDGIVYGRYFYFYDIPLSALLPRSRFFAQRDMTVILIALALGVLSAFFIFFIFRLERSSRKLAELHAQAEARNAADLALARRIQMSVLPRRGGILTENLRLSLRGEMRPAREVGGDFYDFFRAPDGRVVVVIADVAGKGIPAAMFAMQAIRVLRYYFGRCTDPAEAVTMANRDLCAENDAEMFVTVWAGILNPADGRIEYVNAGHNRPFIRRADGSIEKVAGKGGLFLGMFENADYVRNTAVLRKNDRLFLYTDGFTEAMNPQKQCFGEARFCAALRSGDLEGALKRFVGNAEQSDDLTSVAIDFFGAPEAAERTFPCEEASFAAAQDFLREKLRNIAPAVTAKILNAADEVIVNIVSYSGASDFLLRTECGRDRVKIEFRDAGKPYNPLKHSPYDMHVPIAERPVGGLGLVIVRRLIHWVTYRHIGGRNVLVMVQKLDG